jgi:hypothetical protein
MSAISGPPIIKSGLILNLDAANRKSYSGSGTIWYDRSGNGNNGTLIGGVGYNNSNVKSLIFDGANNRIDCGTSFPSVISGTNSFSIECWVYPLNTQPTYSDIWGNHTEPVVGIVMQQNASILNQYSWGWGNGVSWASSGFSNFFNLIAFKWNHLVAIRNGSSVQTYLNGNLIDATSNSSSILSNSSFNFQIGTGYNLGSSRYFNGNISNFKIYNRALSAQEILQNFNATKSRFGL